MLPLARQPPHKFPLRGHILQARPVPEVEDARHAKRIRALLRERAVLILPAAWEVLGNAYVIARFVRQ